MAEWYYSAGDGVQRGPVDSAALKRLAASGRLSPSDLIWREGMTEWAPASKVNGLFPAVEPPPPMRMGADADIDPHPHPRSIARRDYAGFWLRVVAYFIYAIAVLFCSLFAGVALGITMVAMGIEPTGEEPIWNLAGILVAWLYYALMESSSRQATLGKMALGLKVTDLDGYPISFARASGRFFGKFFSAFMLCVGFMMAGFTQRKQALHDMIAGTLVIRK